MSPRRVVRVAQSFFDRLDQLLPAERNASGAPSATDFLLHDLPAAIDRLADDYEGTTLEVEEVPGVRVLIASGRLVERLALYTVVASDNSIEIIYLELGAD
jgi:hypothetical protein